MSVHFGGRGMGHVSRMTSRYGPATSPVWVGGNSQTATAGATTLTLTLSAVSAQGGAWLAMLATKNNDVHSCSTGGWTKLAQVNSGASYTTSLWIARTGASNPVFTWTNSVAAGVNASFWKYADGWTINLTVTASSNSNGTVNPVNTAAITATKNNTLAVYGASISQASTLLDTPSGWTEHQENGSATSNIDLAFGSKALALVGNSSGAPSANYFANQTWVMFNVELAWTG